MIGGPLGKGWHTTSWLCLLLYPLLVNIYEISQRVLLKRFTMSSNRAMDAIKDKPNSKGDSAVRMSELASRLYFLTHFCFFIFYRPDHWRCLTWIRIRMRRDGTESRCPVLQRATTARVALCRRCACFIELFD